MKSIPEIKKEMLQTLLIYRQEPISFANNLYQYNYSIEIHHKLIITKILK